MAKRRYITAFPMDDAEVAAEATEEADYDDEVASEAAGKSNEYKAIRQRVPVWMHTNVAGYDVELVDSDGLSRAISQVKWPYPNPLGSTSVDLM